MFKRVLLCVMIALAISACSRSAGSAPTPSATPAVPLIIATDGVPAAHPTSPIVVTPTPALSPTPFVSFTVKPNVDNLKVRMDPGMLFTALILVQQTDEMTVVGMAPGGEWVNIKTASGTEGWVFSQYLTSSVDLTKIPVVDPKDVQLVRGHITDASGLPIQGVVFDLFEGTTAGGNTNTVVSDANGDFYSFLPSDSSGTWTVSQTGIGCPASNVWMDSTCKTYKNSYTGTVDPASQTVTLPQTAGTTLIFTFK